MSVWSFDANGTTWTTSTRGSSSATRRGARCTPRRSSTTRTTSDVGRRLKNLDDLKQIGFAAGLCIALAYHHTQARVLGPVLSATLDGESTTRLQAAVAAYDREVGHLWEGHALAA